MRNESPGYGQIDNAYARRLATTAATDDGPVFMVNLMSYKAVATYADGNPDGVTGRQADDRYAPLDVLEAIGARMILVADVEDQLLGDRPAWDRVAIVEYPTRRSFIDMQSRPDFQAKHEHKEAGMEATFVIGCELASWPVSLGDGDDPAWEDVPHPPTDEDGPVVVIHVARYAEATGREAMGRYEEVAGAVARPHGVRIGAWFDVEGTIVGDGRQWDQVRCNLFPSRAAFMAVATDSVRLAAQAAHRAPAMTDTYTLVCRPARSLLDTLAPPD